MCSSDLVDFGGKNGDNLTKDTNFLIVGDYGKCVSIKGNKTGKMKKAEAYSLKGCDIQILSENSFYDIIEDFGGKEHLCHIYKKVCCINIRIKFPKVNFLHYVPPFRFTGD